MKTRIRLVGGLALLLSPLIHGPAAAQNESLPSDYPPPVKAGLEDLASGRTESDETNSDDDTRTLSCSVENETGSVEFSLVPAPSGACRWTIRRDETELETGFLDKSNGCRATCDGLAPGLYSLEVTGQGGDNLRRKINFLTGLGNAESAKKGRDALKLHGAKDYHGLIKALEKLDVQAASVPPQMREDLAWARIDGLFFYRKFEDVFSAIEAFRKDHRASAHMTTVTEYEMAARFERGLKMTLEAVKFQNESSDQRRAAGVSDFGRFLSLAATRSADNYTVLPKRDLRQDLWTVRVILGEEQAVLKEIPATDAAGREKFHLLSALLYPKIHPDQADGNLQRMKDYLRDYPKSPACPRVEFDMAGVALNEGIRLSGKADLPLKAAPYFESARGIFNRIIDDKQSGFPVADVAEAWDGILRSHYWERDVHGRKDEGRLMAWSERMISASKPGDPSWRQAKLYQSDLLLHQRRNEQAAAVLDELVALGFKGNPSHDGRTSFAVRWRISAASAMGDQEKVNQLRQWVLESNCEDSIRRGWGEGESR